MKGVGKDIILVLGILSLVLAIATYSKFDQLIIIIGFIGFIYILFKVLFNGK